MKFLFVIGSIALTVLSWGMYGPVLHRGQQDMDHTRLLPFFFVGVAYFLLPLQCRQFYCAPVVSLDDGRREAVSGVSWPGQLVRLVRLESFWHLKVAAIRFM